MGYRNSVTGRNRLAVAVGFAVILSACGSAPSEPAARIGDVAGPVPGATAIATTATDPSPTIPATTVPPTPGTPSADPAEAEDLPVGDCTRSIRVANIDYQLAFFSLCQTEPNSPPFPIYRKMEEPPSLQDKLEHLVRGARSYEIEDGLATGFDFVDERDEIDVVANVNSAGTATVDFRINGERWHPGSRASASAQYLSFMDPLEATVFSDAAVTGLDRSTLCWGESDCAGITSRETWEGMLFVNYGLLCDPARAAMQDWGCTARDTTTYAADVVGVSTDDVLNMRSGPGVAYFKIGALQPTATVEVLENHRPAADGTLWRLVRNESGDVGWVNASFLANSAARTGDRTDAEDLVDRFVEFASRPSDEAFAVLPLAETVALGLGPTILASVLKGELRQPATWDLDMEYFRAYVGPFSAFEELARKGDYQVTEGPHNHCASPPVPAPVGYEELTRIGVQPADGSIDSCLMWSTVDFFVNGDGVVEAITYDLWEP